MAAITGLLTRGASNPILTNVGGTYDDLKCGPHSVYKRGPGDYVMLYEGILNGAGPDYTSRTCLATSADGTSWTKYASNPVMSGGVAWENDEACPTSIVWDSVNSRFLVYYHGGNNTVLRKIGVATTTDFISYTKYGSNPILSEGSSGAWDDALIADCKVIIVSPTDYRMYYRGEKASTGVAVYGLATSTDGGFTWTKYPGNPVFGIGAGGQWDDGYIMAFAPFRVSKNEWHAWYIATDSIISGTPAMGYAYSLNDGITWTRGNSNPILVGITGDLPTDSIDVLKEGEVYRVYYGSYDIAATPIQRGIAEGKPKIITPVPEGVLLDGFDRANTGPPPSSLWTNGVTGAAVGGEGLVVLGSQATRASAGNYRQGSYYNARDFGPDLWVIIDLTTYSISGAPGFSFYARLTNPGATFTAYNLDYDQVTPALVLNRVVGGSYSTIDISTSIGFGPGDRVALGCWGSTITAWRQVAGYEWYQLLSGTDTAITGAGKVGLEVMDSQVIRIGAMYVGPIPEDPMDKTTFPKPKLRVV